MVRNLLKVTQHIWGRRAMLGAELFSQPSLCLGVPSLGLATPGHFLGVPESPLPLPCTNKGEGTCPHYSPPPLLFLLCFLLPSTAEPENRLPEKVGATFYDSCLKACGNGSAFYEFLNCLPGCCWHLCAPFTRMALICSSLIHLPTALGHHCLRGCLPLVRPWAGGLGGGPPSFPLEGISLQGGWRWAKTGACPLILRTGNSGLPLWVACQD